MRNNQGANKELQMLVMEGEPERSRPEGVPTFYANNANFKTSLWDLTIDFGVIVGQSSTGGPKIQDVATVIMSPQHAKIFVEVLARNIQGYEEQFGEIPRPPQEPPSDPSVQ
jgi:hypothetical protein